MYNYIFIIIQIVQAMKIAAEANAHQYAIRINEHRIAQVKFVAREMTKKARMRRKQAKFDLTETNKSTEDLLYSPEIDDSR